MADPVSSTLTLGAIGTKLGGFVWDQLTKAAPGLLKKFKEKRELDKAVENYLQRYMDAYGSIRPLGMNHSISLEQIYTEVQFTTEDLRQHFSEKLIEKTAKRELRKSLDQKKIQKLDGITAANQLQRMLVVGNPGGGKSIYLQRIGWECLRSHGIRQQGHSGQLRYEHELLPVLLELKRCRSDEKAPLVELLAREFADCGFPESVPMVEALLKAGKLLVLLDALDEVAQDRVAVIVDQAQSLIRRYPDCRFIISCRIAFRHDYFRDFQDVTMLEFTDEQISHFIHNWFCGAEQKEEKIAERFVGELHQGEHRATLELARSPVLLGYLCVGYQGTLQLSSNRAEIYRRALDIFLQEWNAKNLKTAHIRQVHASLPPETELLMLAQIAYEALKQERFFLTKDEWLKSIRDFMTDLVDRPKALPVGDILENIAVSQGLVVQRTHQDWSFSHLTLQEYLAAYHIDQHGLMEGCVQSHLGDERWQEVFLILAGIKPGPLLQSMIHVANERMLLSNPRWEEWRVRLNAWNLGTDSNGAPERMVVGQMIAGYMYGVLDSAVALSCAHDLALSRASDQYRSKDNYLVGHSLSQALSLSHDQALAYGIAIMETLARDHVFNFNFARAKTLARDLAIACGFARGFTKDRERAQARSSAHSNALDLIGSLLKLEEISETMRSDLLQLKLVFESIGGRPKKSDLQTAAKEIQLPFLESPEAKADYFANLHFILRCKKAGAQKLKASEWKQVLEQIF